MLYLILHLYCIYFRTNLYVFLVESSKYDDDTECREFGFAPTGGGSICSRTAVEGPNWPLMEKPCLRMKSTVEGPNWFLMEEPDLRRPAVVGPNWPAMYEPDLRMRSTVEGMNWPAMEVPDLRMRFTVEGPNWHLMEEPVLILRMRSTVEDHTGGRCARLRC